MSLIIVLQAGCHLAEGEKGNSRRSSPKDYGKLVYIILNSFEFCMRMQLQLRFKVFFFNNIINFLTLPQFFRREQGYSLLNWRQLKPRECGQSQTNCQLKSHPIRLNQQVLPPNRQLTNQKRSRPA